MHAPELCATEKAMDAAGRALPFCPQSGESQAHSACKEEGRDSDVAFFCGHLSGPERRALGDQASRVHVPLRIDWQAHDERGGFTGADRHRVASCLEKLALQAGQADPSPTSWSCTLPDLRLALRTGRVDLMSCAPESGGAGTDGSRAHGYWPELCSPGHAGLRKQILSCTRSSSDASADGAPEG
jgi:hypothetical protein